MTQNKYYNMIEKFTDPISTSIHFDINNLPSTLNLEKKSLTDNDIAQLMTSPQLYKIYNLDLSHNKITFAGIKTLVDNFDKLTNLRTLNLNNNNIGAEAARIIADKIKDKASLKILNLNNTNIGKNGMKYILDNAQHIIILILSNNNIIPFTNNEISDVFNNVSQLNNLQDLGLNNIKLGDNGLFSLFNKIDNLKSLKYLKINTNNITDDSIISISHLIPSFKSLKYIYLNNNMITQLGVEYLALAATISNIRNIYIYNNRIELPTGQSWARYIKSINEKLKSQEITTKLSYIQDVKLYIENYNIVLNYKTSQDPNIDILKDKFNKSLIDINNLNVEVTLRESFADSKQEDKFNVKITMIPSRKSSFINIFTKIKNDINTLISMPEKKSYFVWFFMIIILLILSVYYFT